VDEVVLVTGRRMLKPVPEMHLLIAALSVEQEE
jgi:hypothetical protein